MDHDDFDNVSWRNEPSNETSRPNTSGSVSSPESKHTGRISRRRTSYDQPQAGQDADAVDLAGIGEYGRLDCTVETPLKENDGTKDAYVSYLVTTQVALSMLQDPAKTADGASRATLQHSKNHPSAFAGASQISSSCTKPSASSSQPMQYRLCQTSTRWNMSGVTGLGLTLPHAEHIH